MSRLARLLKTSVPGANPANPDVPDEMISSFSNISRGGVAVEAEAEERTESIFSPTQLAARQQATDHLRRYPNIKRAFVNRFAPDGTMIVTLAIRGIGTGELLIPPGRFSQGSLADYGALLAIIGNAETANA